MTPFTFRRRAARVILLDSQQRVLLLQARDPADGRKPTWWEVPGGGINPGESSEEAARRELLEETGIDAVKIGPCVWTQHAEFDFGGFHFDQDEWIHVAWTDGEVIEQAPTLEALEVLAFHGRRWWPVDELVASDVLVLPTRLRQFLPDLAAGRLPTEPVDVGDEPGFG